MCICDKCGPETVLKSHTRSFVLGSTSGAVAVLSGLLIARDENIGFVGAFLAIALATLAFISAVETVENLYE